LAKEVGKVVGLEVIMNWIGCVDRSPTTASFHFYDATMEDSFFLIEYLLTKMGLLHLGNIHL